VANQQIGLLEKWIDGLMAAELRGGFFHQFNNPLIH
jgi:hypothetical protein